VVPLLQAAVLLLRLQRQLVRLQAVLLVMMMDFASPGGAAIMSWMGLTFLGWSFRTAPLQEWVCRCGWRCPFTCIRSAGHACCGVVHCRQ
jgi:hypothetical protein